MNQITTTTTPSSISDPAASALIAHVGCKNADGTITHASRALKPAERDQLMDRCAVVRKLAQPARGISDREKIGAAIAEMLAGFMNARSSNPAATVAVYVRDLEQFPVWIVEEACREVRRGLVDGLNPDFPPSCPRMMQVCAAKMEPLRTEERSIKTLLTAPTEPPDTRTPEQIAHVAEGMRTLAERMKAADPDNTAEIDRRRSEATQRTIDTSRKMTLREYAAAGLDPVTGPTGQIISLGLARKIASEKLNKQGA